MVWSNKLCKFCQTNYYTCRARTEMLFIQILPSNIQIVSVCGHCSQNTENHFNVKCMEEHQCIVINTLHFHAFPLIVIKWMTDCSTNLGYCQNMWHHCKDYYQIMWHHFKDKHFVTTQLTMHSHVLNNWYTAA